MKRTYFYFLVLFLSVVNLVHGTDFTQFFNPCIGIGGHGHTFPGACVPNGLVQLSPDTDTEGWDWISGYRHTNTSIMGFSHTHLSGTGCPDLGVPVIKSATICLDNGKTFAIRNLLKNDKALVKSVWLNGKILKERYITHIQIMAGGELVFR